MFVEITCGTYGYRDEKGHIKPMNRGSVIDLDEDEARYLLSVGDAVIAEAELEMVIPEAETTCDNLSPVENTEAQEDDSVESDMDLMEPTESGLQFSKEKLNALSFAKLKEIADDLQIEGASKIRSKAKMIEAILSFDADSDDGDDMFPFDLDAEDPV